MTKSKVRKSQASGLSGCVGYGFFIAFALAGLGAAYFLTILPILRIFDARSWVRVPCVVESSEVEEIEGEDGYTYRVAITYRFDLGGRTYYGDRYDFSTGSSSGYKRKARIVAAHPEGQETLCFADPENPEKSVIDRSAGSYLWWGLFPLPFLAVGFGGLAFLIFSRQAKSKLMREGRSSTPRLARTARTRTAVGEASQQAQSRLPEEPASDRGYVALEPEGSRIARVVGMAIVSLFWNGFVGVFLFSMYSDDELELIPLLFMTPFVLAGLALLGFFLYMLFALFNPKPHFVLNSTWLTLGKACSARWWMTGSAGRLRKLTISLEAREKATYRRGTDTKTDHHVFLTQTLVSLDHPGRTPRDTLTFQIPERTMPSFEAPNNKIEWRLTVHGDIPFWPDVHENFPLTVHPRLIKKDS